MVVPHLLTGMVALQMANFILMLRINELDLRRIVQANNVRPYRSLLFGLLSDISRQVAMVGDDCMHAEHILGQLLHFDFVNLHLGECASIGE